MNNQPAQSVKYILYVRKSTEGEERQQLSIPAQLDEVRKFAKDNNLNIIKELTEKKSAKTPGRPVFNQLLAMITTGQADGIISWHPDRLARNALDAGQLFYLLDQQKLQDLKFASFRFDNDPNGRFMLSIAFGQSQYFSDALSVNTKRGLIAKCKTGWRPGKAPFGYRNRIRNGVKVIVPVPKEADLIKQVFQNYVSGSWSLIKVQEFLTQNGVKGLRKNNTNGKMQFTAVRRILSNLFYIGQFYFAGDYWPGKHQPIIDRQLFEKVQEVLKNKSPMRHHSLKIKFQKHRFPFTSFINCADCGFHIAAEQHTKFYKTTGKHQIFVYYVCHSRKSVKLQPCRLPIIRERELLRRFPPVLKQLSFNQREYRLMLSFLAADKNKITKDRQRLESVFRLQVNDIKSKLNSLVDLYLDGNLDKQIYQDKRRFLTAQLRNLESQLEDTSTDVDRLFQPLERFLNNACQSGILAAKLAAKLAADEISPSDFTAVSDYLVSRAKQKKGVNSGLNSNLDFPHLHDLPNLPNFSSHSTGGKVIVDTFTTNRESANLNFLSPSTSLDHSDLTDSGFSNSNLPIPGYSSDYKVPSDRENSPPEESENRRFLLRLDQHLRQIQNQNSNLTLSGNSLFCRGKNEWAALARRPRTRCLERDTRIGLAPHPWEGCILPLY